MLVFVLMSNVQGLWRSIVKVMKDAIGSIMITVYTMALRFFAIHSATIHGVDREPVHLPNTCDDHHVTCIEDGKGLIFRVIVT